ncbi:hypothetical protein DMENIID0001_009370 [Sergentomyia squamirostris]
MSTAKGSELEVMDVEEEANDSSTEEKEKFEKFLDTLQKVLGRYYYRSAERLQMHIRPPCYSNLERCSQTHWRNQEITQTPYSMISDCRMQKKHGKFSCLFSYINNICVSGSFPGPDILTLLMQILLDVSVKVDPNEEPPEFVVHQSIQQFEMIMMQFPPCILQLESAYSTLLTQKCELEGLEEYCDGQDGIIVSIINTLEHLLQNKHQDDEGSTTTMEMSTDTEETIKYLNLDKKGGFNLLPFPVKLDRLFVILHLLVKLMEVDLAMWMLRHPKKASGSMLKPAKQPLIAKILWPTGDFSITIFMKKAFNVFVEMIVQEISGFQMEIFERFIGLVSNAVNLCEIQTSAEVQYPCIRQKSSSLAETFMQIITDYKDSTPSLTLKVLKHMKSPIAKMLMIDNFFSSIMQNSEPVSITKIFRIFKKRDWVNQNKISQREFVQLFMDNMQCWLDVYRLHDVMAEYSGNSPTPSTSTSSQSSSKRLLSERLAEKERLAGKRVKINFQLLNKNIKGIMEKFTYDSSITYNELNLDSSIIGVADIYQIYLDEMKSAVKLHQLLVSRDKKYPTFFGPWIEMIEKHFGYALLK